MAPLPGLDLLRMTLTAGAATAYCTLAPATAIKTIDAGLRFQVTAEFLFQLGFVMFHEI
jgi:hypothetical protein